MNVSLYHAAAALNANERWQEVIAENLASSSIPGFKKQELSFATVQAGVPPAGGNAGPNGSLALPRATPMTSFLPGELRFTAGKTDVAIEGPAFFEVQLPDGGTAYTRDGEFQISAQGQLITKRGFLVMGDGGPIQIDLQNATPLAISPTGEVSQGQDVKGRLKLTEFDDPRRLTQVNGGLFMATAPGAAGRPSQLSTVRQGWLEGANTSVSAEMANLLTAMRSFEANQRVITLQDERLAKTIQHLSQT